MGKIEVKIPTATFKGKQIIRVRYGYKVKGDRSVYKTLTAATDSI